jgi:potassium efflux system protein
MLAPARSINLLLICVIGLLASPAMLIAQDESAPEKEAVPTVQAIEISEISAESEKVMSTLESGYRVKVRDSILTKTRPVIDTLKIRLTEVTDLTNTAIEQNYPADLIQSFIAKWDDLISKIEKPLESVTAYTKQLEDIRKDISATRKRWEFTSKELDSEEVESVEASDRIKFILNQLSVMESELKDSLDHAISTQNTLTDLKYEATNEKKAQETILQKEIGTLLTERVNYIWQMQNDTSSAEESQISKDFYYSYNLTEARNYLREFKSKFYYISLIFIGFVLLLYWMVAKLDSFDRFESSIAQIGRGIFKRPVISALFLASISAIPFLKGGPIFISLPMIAAILLSFVFLVPVTIPRQFRWPVYAFTLLYMSFLVRDILPTNETSHRTNELLLSLGLLGFMIWFRIRQHKFEMTLNIVSVWFGLLKIITPLYLIALIIAIGANMLGFIHLSYLITDTVVRSYFIAIVFGIVYSTFTAVFTLFLYTPLAQQINILNNYRDLIIKRAKSLFQVLFVLFWLRFTLESLHLFSPAQQLLQDFLALGLKLENFEVTIGNFLNFGLIILAAWLISNLIRLLLQDEILSRFDLPKGVPMAVASLTYYVLFVIGIIMAMLALGFDITHLSVLAGALGIGIGFGLQNVVNNFISGLILIFERPITVGDIVNLQTIEGQVISIGIRSSKVQQYDGSVLIVPNADLISNQVVNFTLTDDKRRFILPIYTDTDVDPARVLEIMTEAAASVPEVISNPPARSYFTGTEDQSRVFKLYFWVSGLVFLKAKSDVTVLVHQKLEENGIVGEGAEGSEVEERGMIGLLGSLQSL